MASTRCGAILLAGTWLGIVGCGGGGDASGTPPVVVQAPRGLTYSSLTPTYSVGRAIPPNSPTSGGGAVAAYAVTPALPAGLTLDSTSGIIGGTPTAISAEARYEVTASNITGSTTAPLMIAVRTAGNWSLTGSMIVARSGHSATLLPGGKVLVASGFGATAELYDPAVGTWTATGSLGMARTYHTATLLPNGKVLVAGGEVGGLNSALAEIYDPATGNWTAAASMGTARSRHSATLLASGRVLVTGGFGVTTTNATAEVFDPGTGTWTPTASMGTARSGHSATLLASGKVLVMGGKDEFGAATYFSSAEVYDPTTGSWSATGGLAAARAFQMATLLPNGRVLVAGGINTGGSIASAEIYDPSTGTFTATSSMGQARWGTATLLPGGKVLAASGSGIHFASLTAELYDPATGTWATTVDLKTFRDYPPLATLLQDGRVLVTGEVAATELFSIP